MVSNKFLQDDGEDEEVLCSEWAASGGLELCQLKRLEVEFLNAIVSASRLTGRKTIPPNPDRPGHFAGLERFRERQTLRGGAALAGATRGAEAGAAAGLLHVHGPGGDVRRGAGGGAGQVAGGGVAGLPGGAAGAGRLHARHLARLDARAAEAGRRAARAPRRRDAARAAPALDPPAGRAQLDRPPSGPDRRGARARRQGEVLRAVAAAPGERSQKELVRRRDRAGVERAGAVVVSDVGPQLAVPELPREPDAALAGAHRPVRRSGPPAEGPGRGRAAVAPPERAQRTGRVGLRPVSLVGAPSTLEMIILMQEIRKILN